MPHLTVAELCAGGGGQAIGLEAAGWQHSLLVDHNADACATLRANRPWWDIRCSDLADLDGKELSGVDLIAGGVPCTPFSVAGQRNGPDDCRDMFPEALRIVAEAQPRSVMFENSHGLAQQRFAEYRSSLTAQLSRLGYETIWRTMEASLFGVPQRRSRLILVGLHPCDFSKFMWPLRNGDPPCTVGEALLDLMGSRGWAGAERWATSANRLAPTIVGGSHLHGGADLGPSHSKRMWRNLGVDARSLADEPPSADDDPTMTPRLTVRMAARIQCVPDGWELVGSKSAAYRQVGNALPPPVAEALGIALMRALAGADGRPVRCPDMLVQPHMKL